MNKLTEVFCDVDDFCRVFIPEWEKQLITDGTRQRNRHSRMSMSEVMRRTTWNDAIASK
jgi:hypothetical protein